MRRKKLVGEDFAVLAEKYEVDPDSLFDALLEAGENTRAKCGDLTITCRGKIDDQLIFLITFDSTVAAQIRVSPEFLNGERNQIKTFMDCRKVQNIRARRKETVVAKSIQDLRSGMKGVDLEAEVLKVSNPNYLISRFGTACCLVKALLADATGQIPLCLWNERSKLLSPGDTVQIGNGKVSTFRGEAQLSLPRNGTISIIEE